MDWFMIGPSKETKSNIVKQDQRRLHSLSTQFQVGPRFPPDFHWIPLASISQGRITEGSETTIVGPTEQPIEANAKKNDTESARMWMFQHVSTTSDGQPDDNRLTEMNKYHQHRSTSEYLWKICKELRLRALRSVRPVLWT